MQIRARFLDLCRAARLNVAAASATALLLCAVWLAVWWTLQSEYKAHSQLALNQADNAAHRLADRTVKMLDQFRQTVLLSKHLYERDGRLDFESLANAGLTGNRERVVSYLISSDGLVTASSNPPMLGQDLSDRGYFRETRYRNELIVSEAVFGRVYKRWMVPMALAMRDPLGRFTGASAVAFDAAMLTDDFPVGQYQDTVVAVLHDEGHYLSRRVGDQHTVGDKLDGQRLQQLVSQQMRNIQPVASPLDRVARFAAAVPIEAYGLHALVAVPASTALAAYYTLRTEVLIAAIVASLAIVAGAVALTRQAQRLGHVEAERATAERRLVSEKKRLQTTLRSDALTGLPNRSAFEARLDAALAGSGERNTPHVLMFIDLDQFKVVNDTCGHAAGDLLLKELSKLLGHEIRKNDMLARLGGDEFGVLLESCPREPALRVAEAMRQRVATFRFAWLQRTFQPSISIGLVPFSGDALGRVELLRLADSACYVAKEAGRNRVHVYDETDTAVAHRYDELDWVTRLQRALAEDLFVLHGQRIAPIQADGDTTEHIEILIRLRGDDGSIISPMSFIPPAERYGLMPAIDRWVIAKALSVHAQHARETGRATRFSINLSGATLGDPTLLDFVKQQLATHEVPAHYVCFEVTETTAIDSLAVAAELIGRLRALGCRFALDDFGSGMSSFAYLKRLPLDYVKIDGGFVKDMLTEPVDHAMVEAIHNIARRMGLGTVAEFVENQATVEALRRLGIDYVQGYGVQKPRPLLAAAAPAEATGPRTVPAPLTV